jgi:hypothetical protein
MAACNWESMNGPTARPRGAPHARFPPTPKRTRGQLAVLCRHLRRHEIARRGEVLLWHAGRGSGLDATVAYDRGPVGEDLGPLAVGHFNRLTRPDATDRMFRGLIDEIRVHGSPLDGTGALTLEQIRAVQRAAAPTVRVAVPPGLRVSTTGGS